MGVGPSSRGGLVRTLSVPNPELPQHDTIHRQTPRARSRCMCGALAAHTHRPTSRGGRRAPCVCPAPTPRPRAAAQPRSPARAPPPPQLPATHPPTPQRSKFPPPPCQTKQTFSPTARALCLPIPPLPAAQRRSAFLSATANAMVVSSSSHTCAAQWRCTPANTSSFPSPGGSPSLNTRRYFRRVVT